MLLLLLSLLAAGDSSSGPPIWPPYVQVEGIYGDIREGIDVTLFTPVLTDSDTIVFSELVGGRQRHQSTVSSGLGMRRLLAPNVALGFNSFLDYTHVRSGANFIQGGVGAELLVGYFGLRANGYLPWTTPHRLSTAPRDELLIEGTQVIDFAGFSYTEQDALSGGDVELAYNLEGNQKRLRGFAGYRHFFRKGYRNLQGPRLRLQAEIDNLGGICRSQLIVAGEWVYDAVYRHQGSVWVGLRIPFYGRKRKEVCRPLSTVRRRMGDPVRRQLMPVLSRRSDAFTDRREVLANIFFIEQNGAGPGTQTNPTDLTTAQAEAEPGDILFFLNDTGTIDPTTVILQDNQRMIGFGDADSVIISFGPGRDLEVDDLTGAGRATLNNPGGAPVVTLANSNEVSGIQLTGGLNGVQGTGISAAMIRDVIFDGQSVSGLNLTSTSNVSMTGSTIQNAAGPGVTLTTPTGLTSVGSSIIQDNVEGVVITGGTGSALFTDTIITDTGNRIIDIDNTGGVISFTSGAITNTNGLGIRVQDTVGGSTSFENVTINSAVATAITLANNSAASTFTGAAITTTAGITGVDITGGTATGNVTFASSTLTQSSGGQAVTVDSTAALIDTSGLTVSNSNSAGLNVLSVTNTTAGSVDFGSVDINNASGADAVFLDSNVADVSVTTLDADVTGGAGIAGSNSTGAFSADTITITDATNGINLNAFDGDLDVTGTTTITNATNDGIIVIGSASDVTFNRLEIVDPAIDGIDLDTNTGDFTVTSGGGITFNSSQASSGIVANNIEGLSINGTSAADRFTIVGPAGSGGPADYGIQTTNADSVTLDFVSISQVGPSGGAEAGLFAVNTQTAVSVTNSVINQIQRGHAVRIQNTGHSGTLTINIADNEIAGNGVNFSTTNRAIFHRYNSNTAGNVLVTIDNNQIDGVTLGIDIRTQGNAGTGTDRNRYTITNNIVQDLNVDGMDYRVLNTSATEFFINDNDFNGLVNLAGTPNRGLDFVPAQLDGTAFVTARRNQVRNFLQEGFRFRRGNAGSTGSLTLLLDMNEITATGNRGIDVESGGGSVVNATLTSNTVNNAAPDGIRARHNGPAGGSTLRLNADGNEAPRYDLNDSGAAGAVFQLGGSLGTGMTFVNSDNGNLANNLNTTSLGAPNVVATGSITIVNPASIPVPPLP